MKKLLVVLLSLGLIVAFSAPASAVDAKFSGGYYVVGVYDNNPQLVDKDGYSRAAFFQRLRLQGEFVVAEGLSMTARFDALEKQWGNTDYRSWTTADQDKTNSRVYSSSGSVAATGEKNATMKGKNIQENLELERGFITAKTGIGQFDVGYQIADKWGTNFGDSECTRPRIKFTTKVGPMTLLAVYEKIFEADSSSVVNLTTKVPTYAGKVDVDADNYFLAGIYGFKGGEAGLLFKYVYDARPRVTAVPYKTKVMALVPYFKTTIGPVYLEGEMSYAFGKAAEMEIAGVQDVDMKGYNAYLMAKMTMGPAYFGGQIAWVSGDDKQDATKNTTGPDGGYDYKPTLILNNVDYGTWIPNGADSSNYYKNDSKGFFLYNVFGGFNPTPKWNIEAGISVVAYDKKAVTKTTELVSDKIGTELDITATYKIFDNLTYMVGAGYIITGDAWKGTSATNPEVGNNYMLLNKLTLNF